MDLPSRPYDNKTTRGVLQAVAWSLRSTRHTAVQASPGQVTFGRDMVVNATYLENWRMIKERKRQSTLYNDARENRNCIPFDYQHGQPFICNK